MIEERITDLHTSMYITAHCKYSMHYAISNQLKFYYSRIIFLNFLNVYGLLICGEKLLDSQQ